MSNTEVGKLAKKKKTGKKLAKLNQPEKKIGKKKKKLAMLNQPEKKNGKTKKKKKKKKKLEKNREKLFFLSRNLKTVNPRNPRINFFANNFFFLHLCGQTRWRDRDGEWEMRTVG